MCVAAAQPWLWAGWSTAAVLAPNCPAPSFLLPPVLALPPAEPHGKLEPNQEPNPTWNGSVCFVRSFFCTRWLFQPLSWLGKAGWEGHRAALLLLCSKVRALGGYRFSVSAVPRGLACITWTSCQFYYFHLSVGHSGYFPKGKGSAASAGTRNTHGSTCRVHQYGGSGVKQSSRSFANDKLQGISVLGCD